MCVCKEGEATLAITWAAKGKKEKTKSLLLLVCVFVETTKAPSSHGGVGGIAKVSSFPRYGNLSLLCFDLQRRRWGRTESSLFFCCDLLVAAALLFIVAGGERKTFFSLFRPRPPPFSINADVEKRPGNDDRGGSSDKRGTDGLTEVAFPHGDEGGRRNSPNG